MTSLLCLLAVGVAAADGGVEPAPEASVDWVHGEHLTGQWGGARTWLAERGVTFDLAYATELFSNVTHPGETPNGALIGHLDAAVTVDFEQLGLWRGGKLYVLLQNNHGRGINDFVESCCDISNIEAPPYTQLGEFFYEQTLFAVLRFRLGKQDANREFGTPRFGGNFINNNFGMFPTAPLPSYPTNGLGAVAVLQPWRWLSVKAALFEGQPAVGSYGFDSALAKGAGHLWVASVNATHHVGGHERLQGTTTAGVFRQNGSFDEVGAVPAPRAFHEMWGAFFQNDERLYVRPVADGDPHIITLITRVGWSQPDRSPLGLFLGASLAYHGLGTRADDTAGIGFGWLGTEWYAEVFYKLRITRFLSLQPDLQFYRTPGGSGPDAVLVGLRLKVKL